MNLFPTSANRNAHDALLALYTNPFATNLEIANMTYTNGTLCNYALHKYDLKRYDRYALFTALGYIKIPTGTLANVTVPPRLLRVLSTWQADPSIDNATVAEVLELSELTISTYTTHVYRHFGYSRPDSIPRQFARLNFYWYMGWLDVPRLNLEARIAYRKLYGTAV
jgi:hypothetical protein